MKKLILSLLIVCIAIILFWTSPSMDVKTIDFKPIELSKELKDLSVKTLVDYIQLKTIRDDEDLATQYFKELLEKEGIKTKVIALPNQPNRTILIAEIGENKDGNEGVILAGHSDVVEANAKDWRHDPFAAKIIDGMIYGRGAFDMKGLSVMHFISFLHLVRNKTPLKRKIMFMLLPGEENGGDGAKHIVNNHKELLRGYKYMLNEGAVVSKDIVVKGLKIINIQYAEKGVLWFHIRSKGKPGHGSSPAKNYASLKLVEFINWLQEEFSARIFSTHMHRLFYSIGTKAPGVQSFALKRSVNPVFQMLIEPSITKSKHLSAITTNTVSITGLETPKTLGMNVISEKAQAKIDMRILPGFEATQLFEKISKKAKEMGVEVEAVQSLSASFSEYENKFFKTMAGVSLKMIDNSVVAPFMSPGATDNTHFRRAGLLCYGFYPAIMNSDEVSAMHGIDERISVENMHLGSNVLTNFLLQINK